MTVQTTEVPRWAVRAAYAVPLCVLPSALSRLALLAGLLDGGGTSVTVTPAERLYVLSLSLVSMGLALLTVGLVRPWGERLPGWLPLLGGRRVPIRAAVVPAVTGAGVLIGLCGYLLVESLFDLVGPVRPAIGEAGTATLEGSAQVAVAVTYAPLVAWGPLLLAVAVAYHRRRSRGGRATPGRAASAAATP
ncbi:hypothetical protein [Plantactinospora sp. BB1]|uniref:hypothetical protein n=1 Tax=Plantactinospora sp. BB1 TaxID=2071627 RepID=UPI000D17CA30|nr:hypothetical protein [Plantactinospora sp. BB1]AVT38914.1 hypothetical protein C6W10_23530 [Plantactinospora sp. BB1]